MGVGEGVAFFNTMTTLVYDKARRITVSNKNSLTINCPGNEPLIDDHGN
jgi:hypothetical protein